MEFFNRKEEVLDVNLTPYGKYLLSKGKFKPEFYAFYDGDVIYDSAYIGYGENQTLSEDRIKEIPRIKSQQSYSSAETRINKSVHAQKHKNLSYTEKANLLTQYPTTPDSVYSLSAPLGTSDYNSTATPAWSIEFISGQLSGSTEYIVAEQEKTSFAFSSAAKTAYSPGYVDISTARGKNYRFWFKKAGSDTTSTANVPDNADYEVVEVDISSLSSAATIATAFKSAIDGLGPLNEVKLLTDNTTAGTVAVTNQVAGPVRTSKTNISSITVTVNKQGTSGPRGMERIPQLDVDMITRIEAKTAEEMENIEFEIDNNKETMTTKEIMSDSGLQVPDEISDGSGFLVKTDSLVLRIEEINGIFRKDNFDLEVFQVLEEDENGIEMLSPLKFPYSNDPLHYSMAADFTNNPMNQSFFANSNEDPDYVDHYMSVNIDNAIQQVQPYPMPINMEAPDPIAPTPYDIPTPELPINNYICEESITGQFEPQAIGDPGDPDIPEEE